MEGTRLAQAFSPRCCGKVGPGVATDWLGDISDFWQEICACGTFYCSTWSVTERRVDQGQSTEGMSLSEGASSGIP